jgi:hypothetical protein
MRRSGDAISWLTLAASHGHARATAFLAAIYYTGDGTERDLILATTLMRKAAAEGSPEAKAKLAMMDDTAPPVDVSSPEPATRSAELTPRTLAPAARAVAPAVAQAAPAMAPAARQASATPVQVALPLPTLSAPPAAEAAAFVAHVHYKVRTQVGAFRSAANARHALNLISARMSGTAFEMAIVQHGGFYRVLLISEGQRSATIARARLVRARWQHFAPHRAVVRV